MKNPFRHHTRTDTVQTPHVPDTPAELFDESMPKPMPDPWHHMQRDVDPDCERDPGSDLHASWDLERAAAEEALKQNRDDETKRPPES